MLLPGLVCWQGQHKILCPVLLLYLCLAGVWKFKLTALVLYLKLSLINRRLGAKLALPTVTLPSTLDTILPLGIRWLPIPAKRRQYDLYLALGSGWVCILHAYQGTFEYKE